MLGIISDILESNKERVVQLLSALPSICMEIPTGPLAMLACPICSDLLTDEDALQCHILDRHRHLQVYLKLNGCVLPEVAFVDQPLTELTAVLLGDSIGTLKLTLDDHQLLNLGVRPGKPVAFEKRIPAHYVGKIGIHINIGKADRDYVIYCRTQPSLNIQELDEAIWDLQRPLLEGKEPDWPRFQRNYLHDGSRNALEKQYFAGLYSYLLGCYLEGQRSPQAGKHLGMAARQRAGHSQ